MDKITQEQLDVVLKHQTEVSKIAYEIGVQEHQKHLLIKGLDKLNDEIIEYKKVLEAEYGSININLEDGSYTTIEKEVEELEDVKEDKKD